MKKGLFLLLSALIVFVVLPGMVFSDDAYKQTQGYKDYQKLPEKYKSPEMEKMYRDGYAAEMKVKILKCKKGGTVQDCLDKKASVPAVEDLGWITSPYQGGWNIERMMLLNGTMKLVYKWRVEPDGTVKPVNGKAIGITK